MNPIKTVQQFNRRQFVAASGLGLGAIALNAFSPESVMASEVPHHQPKAKRVIYLFQSGAPSQFETFDYKPGLVEIQKRNSPIPFGWVSV